MSQLSPALRKAAILIHSLDNASADALLDQMSEDDARKVRDAIMELSDIDASEQERIIADFMGGGKPASDENQGVEFSLSAKAATVADATPGAAPFAFLHEALPEVIAKYLLREHPQTIAVVLAHLPPHRAAALALLLPPELQADVLLRVSDIDNMDREIIREVERGLEAVLQHELRATRSRGAGVAALQAIVNAAGTSGQTLMRSVADLDRQLAKSLGHVEAAPTRETPRTFTPPPTTVRRRVPSVQPPSEVRHEPELEFQQLSALDDRAWAKLLRATDSRVALLALAGASPELVERLLAQMQPRDARLLERKMEQLGAVRLREIELAQQQMARIAGQLVSQGEIRLPRSRAFAAAA